ncbi:hypothetical protein SUGI_0425530 [Cryptomeria japonica]|nr:hypothetical protein SUGI_0425530 [Cryptomeria japonica]
MIQSSTWLRKPAKLRRIAEAMEKQKASVSNITKSLKRLMLINIGAGGPRAWLPVPPGRVKAAAKATVAIRTALQI